MFIVTEGNRGLGYSIAEEFVKNGSIVVIMSTSERTGQPAVDKLCELGQAAYVQINLEDYASIKAAFSKVFEKYGKLDVLVNNAALTTNERKNIGDEAFEWVKRTFDANVTGLYACMQLALNCMVETGTKGNVINISSASAIRGYEGMAAYFASKAAVNLLTKCAAIEYASHGIRVNGVMPGAMETDGMKPFRALDPENYEKAIAPIPIHDIAGTDKIAKIVSWMCSNDANYILGHTLVVDGGFTLI